MSRIDKYTPFLKVELKALFREHTSMFFMIIVPIALTVVFGGTFGDSPTIFGKNVLGIDTVVPINVVFLLANTGLMGISITILDIKGQGVFKRYMTYPATYWQYFQSLFAAFLVVSIISTAIFGGMSFVVYHAIWRMNVWQTLLFIIFYLLTALIFFSVGYLISLFITSSRTASLVTSGIFMIFIFTSGIAIPTDSLPEFVQKFAHIFPMYHCIQIMQYLWVGDFELSKIGNNIVYVLILSALMVIILQKVRIQWDSK
ncbi:ABC transporter permease [Lacticaseibacillus zeae]|uniref:Transport permease protein n=1 Tax=Lacticaseibacillus zeae TaxID=57037 RepID=A0A5R8LR18_LACZE|nr:ABC transporter permease [Lacticaseibacillus zeae]TLF39667.1 ABC transporter permease [Lacticaseibacillus zeae]